MSRAMWPLTAGINSGAQLHPLSGSYQMRDIDPMRRLEIEAGLLLLFLVLLGIGGWHWLG